MTVLWTCDKCGSHGHIHPPTEPLFEEREVETEVPEVVGHEEKEAEFEEGYMEDVIVTGPDGKPTSAKASKKRMVKRKVKVPIVEVVKKTIRQKFPKMTTMLRQNHQTGKVESHAIQEHQDLKPRTFVVTITMGQEEITKHLCKKCIKSHMPVLKAAWDALSGLGS